MGFQQAKDYFFSGRDRLEYVEGVHVAKLEGQIVGLNGRYSEDLRHKGIDRTLGIPARHDVGSGGDVERHTHIGRKPSGGCGKYADNTLVKLQYIRSSLFHLACHRRIEQTSDDGVVELKVAAPQFVESKYCKPVGFGYIGSHTCVELLNAGYEVVVLDNLCNSSEKSLERVKKITGKDVTFYKGDILDRDILKKVFEKEKIEGCIHFAGLKAVGESVAKPWEYYNNNITGTLTLVDEMRKAGCKNIIFSSSATVYGDPAQIPITEECPKGTCTNPYGWSKSMLEQILSDMQKADPEWNVILLRYFNPIGAHKSGLIGENPNGIPNNLMPYITQVAVGKLKELGVFGNDYDTPDGTGVRDYIHVVDLAVGHVKALNKIKENVGLGIYNLGTGTGYSVLDIVKNFEEATGVKIPYAIKDRRPGDIATCYSDAAKAKKELGWEAQYGIKEMCADSWNWQKNNPKGYEE